MAGDTAGSSVVSSDDRLTGASLTGGSRTGASLTGGSLTGGSLTGGRLTGDAAGRSAVGGWDDPRLRDMLQIYCCSEYVYLYHF